MSRNEGQGSTVPRFQVPRSGSLQSPEPEPAEPGTGTLEPWNRGTVEPTQYHPHQFPIPRSAENEIRRHCPVTRRRRWRRRARAAEREHEPARAAERRQLELHGHDQITKANVKNLEVAWFYPLRGRDLQSRRRGRRAVRSRPQQLVARRARRDDRQGDLGPRRPERHRQQGHQLLAERGRQGSAAAVLGQQLPAGDRRAHRQVDPDASARTASWICASGCAAPKARARARSRTARAASGETRSSSAARRARRSSRRPATSAPTTSSPGRRSGSSTPCREPGEFGYETNPKDGYKYIGGANNWGEMSVDERARHRLHRDRIGDLRLLRRRSPRRQSLRQLHPRARHADRQAALALPDDPSRPVGSRQRVGAAARDRASQRPQRSTRSPTPARPASSTSSIA